MEDHEDYWKTIRTIVRPSEDHEDHQKPVSPHVALGIKSGCADIGSQYPQTQEKRRKKEERERKGKKA